MSRRCVVCGKYATDNPKEPYHFPRNKKEALIWQRSMGALETGLDSIQELCCVCIKHIPEFVELAKKQAALTTAKSAEQMKRPSLSVLLLPGARPPPYCGMSEQVKPKKEQIDDKLDEDIIVKELNVDCGVKFPDIDETEVTVVRTPMQNEDDSQSKKTQHTDCGDCEQCGDNENMSDFTDVLLLGRNQNFTDSATASQSDLCANLCPLTTNSYPSSPQINLDSNPSATRCECEQKTRLDMSEIIKQQQNRILELEFQLCRQTDWHFAMQQKLNELYAEFGRLEPPSPPSELYCSSHSPPEEANYLHSSSGAVNNGQRTSWHNEPSQ